MDVGQLVFAVVTILVFVIVGASLGVGSGGRDAKLSKLPMLPGEEVLFEIQGITVTLSSGSDDSHTINSFVRVTNRRLIVGYQPLLTKEKLLSHVITHTKEHGAGSDLPTTGVSRCDVDAAAFGLEEPATILIPLPSDGMLGEQTLKIPAPDLEPWREAGLLKRGSGPDDGR